MCNHQAYSCSWRRVFLIGLNIEFFLSYTCLCTGVSVGELEGSAASKRGLPVSCLQDSKRRKVTDTGKQKCLGRKLIN